MYRSEDTIRMPRRIAHMMANAIVGSAQARKKREAVGRGGKPFAKPGQVLVVKKSIGGRQPRPQ
jgi:hypothetical protein